MKKKIMQQWVNALRSGKYKQCQKQLTNGVGFCCLGVLCEIATKKGICQKNGNRYDEVSSTLPISVKNWSGMKDDCGSCDKDDNKCLVALNDAVRQNFGQIANIIERNYPLL